VQTAALASRVPIEPSDPLIKLIDRERKLITEYDLQESARYRSVRETCGQALANLGATLVFPMIAHERLVGALFVGHKKSGKFYTRDDIDLLQSLSTHGAIAIENARLVNIKGAFSHYLAPTVIDELVADPEKLRLGGERREITALFSDIAGFTTTSEGLAPEELVDLLNQYFTETCDVVLRHGGTIDKIVGDALHLLFNAPVDQPDHAERAVRCGLELSECCRRLKTERGLELGDTRIGINTGFAVVGNFGGSARFDYTAHGDAVNTAARLEGANKYLGTLICVSAETRARCGGIAFRPIGKLILQGKHEAVEVYEPLQPGAVSETLLTDYEAAYELMARRDPGARDAFLELAGRFPDDGLICLHADRLRSGEAGDTIRLSGK
jgi:class 3 adenylate cyclase